MQLSWCIALACLLAACTAAPVKEQKPFSLSSLPAELSFAALGCDYEHPTRTADACEEWAILMTDGQPWAYQRLGLETLGVLCEASRAQSCELAALTLEREMPRDVAREQSYRDQACRLGLMRQCGIDVRANAERQQERWRQTEERCRAGDGPSCTEHGGLLWGYERYEEGLELFRRACALGDEQGCRRERMAREWMSGISPP